MAKSPFPNPAFTRRKGENGDAKKIDPRAVFEGLLIHVAVFLGVVVSAFIAMRLISKFSAVLAERRQIGKTNLLRQTYRDRYSDINTHSIRLYSTIRVF